MKPTQTTTVTLLSHTQHVKETIYCQWRASREDGYCPTPAQVAYWNETIKSGKGPSANFEQGVTVPQDTERDYVTEVDEVFRKVVDMKIPLAETIDFVFDLDHVPIALREQMVRHRIGHKFGSQYGADVVPDLADSTFWAQTMRVKNMGEFARKRDYLLPESVAGNTNSMYPPVEKDTSFKDIQPGKSVEQFYREQMMWIESAYNKLIAAGVPIQDARNILPLGCQHRMSWKVNLSSLFHVLGKRGCWIAQLGMWEPVIRGVVEELATKVDSYFRSMIDPPCIGKDGEFSACVFKLENENRVKQDDPYAPCPLYMWNHSQEAHQVALTVEGKPTPAWTVREAQGEDEIYATNPNAVLLGGPSKKETDDYVERTTRYSKLWGRDPFTGNKQDEASGVPVSKKA